MWKIAIHTCHQIEPLHSAVLRKGKVVDSWDHTMCEKWARVDHTQQMQSMHHVLITSFGWVVLSRRHFY